ncbi:MAG: 4-carboxymuconolactone decarboxylase [Fusobacteria bacterium]|nr:MAG: 4-carboxymuconolactone decarboxylase [Fusobacteriota bacterium]KAF0229810.1 MAG: 4-carboxymuconolactone [Fusobacteriota bacterium]
MDKLKKGLETTKKIWGFERDDLVKEYGELGEYILEYAFGEIYSREGLSLRDREIVTISFLIAQGSPELQLRNHFLGALNVGITNEELIEIILQASLYNGFPKAIKALTVLKSLSINTKDQDE